MGYCVPIDLCRVIVLFFFVLLYAVMCQLHSALLLCYYSLFCYVSIELCSAIALLFFVLLCAIVCQLVRLLTCIIYLVTSELLASEAGTRSAVQSVYMNSLDESLHFNFELMTSKGSLF